MKIVLVWPRGFDPNYVLPISLAYLKSNAAQHDVSIVDCALEDLTADSKVLKERLRSLNPDVVGTTCWSHTYHEALLILKTAKEVCPRVTTVIGGPHASSYPDSVISKPEVDFLFRGEAELSFPVFLDELANETRVWSRVLGLVYDESGVLRKNELERKEEMDAIVEPDYDAIQLEKYIELGYRYNTRHSRNAPIWYTRGCPYRCGFCSAPLQNGKPIRAHSLEYMVRWVKRLYDEKGIRQFNIIDDNFTFDMKIAKEFCRQMIALDLKDLHFSTPNGIRMQRSDLELFTLMKQAGWENVAIAPESGSVRTLKRMKKDFDPALVPPKVLEIKKAGLKVHAFFIIGYPGDTREDIKDTVKLIRKCKFDFVFLNNFQPLPGTPIYDELVKTGEIPDGLMPKNYSDGERVYTPEGLRDFNFARFVLKEYAMLALRNPRTIPYMFRLISPRMAAKKVIANCASMFRSQDLA